MSKDSKIFGIPIAKNATGSDQMLAHFLEALKVAKEKVDEITPLYDEIRGNYEFVLETVKRMDPSFDPVKFFGKTSKSPLQDKIMTLLGSVGVFATDTLSSIKPTFRGVWNFHTPRKER